MSTTSPSVTDWISAISTAVLGILGILVTGWQWTRTKFRPKPTARVDQQREAIELVIVNRGRATGIITNVDVVLPNGDLAEGFKFEGFPEGEFQPLALPAMASMSIILETAEGQLVPHAAKMLVGTGKKRPKRVRLHNAPSTIGLSGLHSVLPPAGSSATLQSRLRERPYSIRLLVSELPVASTDGVDSHSGLQHARKRDLYATQHGFV